MADETLASTVTAKRYPKILPESDIVIFVLLIVGMEQWSSIFHSTGRLAAADPVIAMKKASAGTNLTDSM